LSSSQDFGDNEPEKKNNYDQYHHIFNNLSPPPRSTMEKRPSTTSPIPDMPSDLFRRMAQSQLELLANSLSRNSNDSSPSSSTMRQSKVQSMILYLPAENSMTGQLEFAPAVVFPHPDTERVFIASDAASGQAPTLPKTLTKLPGFSHASTLLPGYPMMSAAEEWGVGAVEEVMCDLRYKTAALSVPLLSGSQTVGLLLVSPVVEPTDDEEDNRSNNDCIKTSIQWTEQDKEQVSQAAQSLSMALLMDKERNVLKRQNTAFREGLSDSLHQVKNPIQALRTYGKILQRQIVAETMSSPYGMGGGTPPLLELVNRLMVQSDRVIDLLQPMDDLVETLDRVLLPAAQNDTSSQSMVLWEKPSPFDGVAKEGLPKVTQKEATTMDNFWATSQIGDNPVVDTNGSSSTTLVGDFEVEMTFVNDVLEPVFQTFQAIAAERGISFNVVVENSDDLPGVMAAPKSLQEAVTNVLDNAFKYVLLPKLDSPFTKNPNPRVMARIFPNDEQIEPAGVSLLISDNGPGIDEADRDNIFQRGFRSERTSSMVEGKGIGLDISKALMGRMGGRLDLVYNEDNPSDILDGTSVKLTLFRKPKNKT
jgi:signal transduction histidine kinase